MRVSLWFLVGSGIVLAAAACGNKNKSSNHGNPGAGGSGPPLETRAPNARGQKPAFPGQTRAPEQRSNVRLETTVVTSGLEHPWAIAFLPDGAMLVTERPGRMRIVAIHGTKSEPIAGLPEVLAEDQGGLLDVAIDPAFADNQLVYWSYAEPREGGSGTAVARGRLVRDGQPRFEDVQVIWRMKPTFDSSKHFGSRLVFAPDGTLFVTTGERFEEESRRTAQQLDTAFGKIVRIHPDGSIPKDNPFVGTPGALPEIYSYGHRNIQAAAINPRTDELWEVEHGAKGGDEIDIVRAGANYGWPEVAYGVHYDGKKIGVGTAREGTVQPIYYWDPVIAPSGMAFYDADLIPEWKGSLLVGGLAGQHIARLALDGDRVTGEERLLEGRARFRDVRVGPDGAVYAATDAEDGEILRIAPARDSAPVQTTGR